MQAKDTTTAYGIAKERFGRLTKLQESAYSMIAEGRNLLILAPTGSGKTEAAMLAILDGLARAQADGREETCVYVTPLRALNRDIDRRLGWWCEKLGLELAVRHGDTSAAEKHRQGKKHVHVLITTPETFQGLPLGKNISALVQRIRYVVVDEVHELVDSKRGYQLSLFLERVCMKNARFQRIGISASLALPGEAADMLFGQSQYETLNDAGDKRYEARVVLAKNPEKKVAGLAKDKKTLVFVNTRKTAEELGYKLKALGMDCEVHHGSLAAGVREEAEKKFKGGLTQCLVATSSLELGLDIGDVEQVLQVGSPRRAERLLQRLGRAGHGLERVSRGTIIAYDLEDYFEASAIVRQLVHHKLEEKLAVRNALDITAHQMAGALLEYKSVEARYLYGAFKRSKCFTMEFAMFEKVIAQLAEEWACRYDLGYARLGKRGLKYFVSNISSIQKETKTPLVNIKTGRPISTVDESFLAKIELGMFILSKGEAWAVAGFEDDAILVERVGGSLLVIPDWSGEEIPVSFETAQLARTFWRKKDERFAGDALFYETIPLDWRKIVVLHTWFGDRINATIGRIASELMTSMSGKRVPHVYDSYRVLFEVPRDFDEGIMEKALRGVRKPAEILVASLENAPLFSFKFGHVAVMFGMFDKWKRVHPKLLKSFKDTPVYWETMSSLLREYFDLENAVEILGKMASGGLEVKPLQGRNSQLGLGSLGRNLFVPEKTPAQKDDLARALMQDTLDNTARLGCVHCGKWFFKKLSGTGGELQCPNCSGRYVYFAGLLWKAQVINDYGRNTADLVSAYSWDAVLALSVFGIGPRKAKQVLAKKHASTAKLFEALYEAQQEFLRNRRFWSVA